MIVATSTPVIDATRSGGYSASTRWRSSSAPTVAVLRYSSSWSPSRQMMCIRPSASAASVPGRGWMCQSERRAVGLLYGSTVTIVAPARRASIIKLQRWLLVLAVFDPQLTMNLHLGTASGSAPSRPRPSVYS